MSDRADFDLEHTRGDDWSDTFTVLNDEDDTPVDISDRTYKSQIRPVPDSTTFWELTPSIDGPAGKVTFTLLEPDTQTVPPGRLVWDAEQWIDGVKKTAFGGYYVVWPDVTR